MNKDNILTGWITNNGKIVECEPWEHLKTDDPMVRSVWSEYEDIVDGAYENCASAQEEGEHPEWHIYEICLDNCQSKALVQLYNKGYIRVSNYGTNIAINGTRKAIESQKYVLKKLSDFYECNIIKYFHE